MIDRDYDPDPRDEDEWRWLRETAEQEEYWAEYHAHVSREGHVCPACGLARQDSVDCVYCCAPDTTEAPYVQAP